MSGGIGYSLYLHAIFLLLPKFLLFSPKGFSEYPNHEKVKEKVKKETREEEDQEARKAH